MFAPVLLQDLPAKISHRLLRALPGLVDGAFPAHGSFHKLAGRAARLGRRLVGLHTLSNGSDAIPKMREISWNISGMAWNIAGEHGSA